MLAEMVDHVIDVDPDRDWITAAVVDARTTGCRAFGVPRLFVGCGPDGLWRLFVARWIHRHHPSARTGRREPDGRL